MTRISRMKLREVERRLWQPHLHLRNFAHPCNPCHSRFIFFPWARDGWLRLCRAGRSAYLFAFRFWLAALLRSAGGGERSPPYNDLERLPKEIPANRDGFEGTAEVGAYGQMVAGHWASRRRCRGVDLLRGSGGALPSSSDSEANFGRCSKP